MDDVRLIAFYLPQYHPIPENDEWWGKGFTEWRNVAMARPRFPGHYQPHLPADLGFCDLRVPETREAQAALAREYGIHGFCYYHYWFNGRRILERPFHEVLKSGKPDFPFCLCWANENWTRAWDGRHGSVLLEQHYSEEDDIAHIESLIPAFRDQRYIRVNDKPLLLVYRTELLPDPAKTACIWREISKRRGVGDLYLARVENFVSGVDPAECGFDAAVAFAPDGTNTGKIRFRGLGHRLLSRLGFLPRIYLDNMVFRYDAVAKGSTARPDPSFKRFHCVTPMWDNSARKGSDAWIMVDSTPEKYERWLREMIQRTISGSEGDERIVFLNAWNEWAEGCHLEPDLRWGRAYLEATQRARNDLETATDRNGVLGATSQVPTLKKLYWKAMNYLAEQIELAKNMFGQRS